MQNANTLFVPEEAPPELPAAQQKQIRDAMAAIAVRGEHYAGEIASARYVLSQQFALFNADCAKAARAAKGKAS